ncbi:MAG TPA: hypothetical protein VK139_03075 [Microbacteriaceae bacterium]|nr:hypothetical protein [Microbacteriaceae bacterium]
MNHLPRPQSERWGVVILLMFASTLTALSHVPGLFDFAILLWAIALIAVAIALAIAARAWVRQGGQRRQ